MERKTVENVLMEIGMPVRLKGFAYITDAVLLMDTPEWKHPKWTAMYYKIALMHHTTATRVERAIRNAFASTRNHPDNYDLLEHYIGFTNCENSNSITYLYKTIKLEFPDQKDPEPVRPASARAAASLTGHLEGATSTSFDLTPEALKTMVRQTIMEMFATETTSVR